MLAMGNKGVSLSLPVRGKYSNGAKDRARGNEVIDEIKQHEDFTLTYRVLDLTSCGLLGVSDASLGGVGRFGCPN